MPDIFTVFLNKDDDDDYDDDNNNKDLSTGSPLHIHVVFSGALQK